MHPDPPDFDETGAQHLRGPARRANHWLGSIRAGVGSPAMFAPVVNWAVFDPLITVTVPGPAARQPACSAHGAAVRSSTPASATPRSSPWAHSLPRCPD